MSFAEFDSVNCHSQAILDLLQKAKNQLVNQQGIHNIVIAGSPGSGRKTFANYLTKKFSVAPEKFSIIDDSSELTEKENIALFEMPDLADRKDDLLPLSEFYIQVHALMSGKGRIILSEKAKEKILAYAWPGNFPELERVLEKAVETSVRNIIEPENLNLEEAAKNLNFTLGLKLENVERQYILQTLFFVQQNRTRAAEVLGISIRTLRNKLNQYRQEGYL